MQSCGIFNVFKDLGKLGLQSCVVFVQAVELMKANWNFKYSTAADPMVVNVTKESTNRILKFFQEEGDTVETELVPHSLNPNL